MVVVAVLILHLLVELLQVLMVVLIPYLLDTFFSQAIFCNLLPILVRLPSFKSSFLFRSS